MSEGPRASKERKAPWACRASPELTESQAIQGRMEVGVSQGPTAVTGPGAMLASQATGLEDLGPRDPLGLMVQRVRKESQCILDPSLQTGVALVYPVWTAILVPEVQMGSLGVLDPVVRMGTRASLDLLAFPAPLGSRAKASKVKEREETRETQVCLAPQGHRVTRR